MNILVIDTSTDLEFLALSAGGTVYEFCEAAGVSHSVTMFRNLEDLLSSASIEMKDISLIGVGAGPGSFTGIRIAVSTARMFAQILNIPLVGLKSPEIYAASVTSVGSAAVISAFDAKKSRVFGGVYSVNETLTHEITPPGDYSIEELLISAGNPGELLLIGDGCEKYIYTIESYCGKNGIRFRMQENFHPDGKAAVELTLRKYKESPSCYTDYNNTVPFYSRKSDAEIAKRGL